MYLTKIKIKKLVEGEYTYPTWTTNSVYPLKTQFIGNSTSVFYNTKSNREISRIFPNDISLTPRLIYALGLLKGEGPTSLGKSNYRRITITNSNPAIINIILEEFDKNNLFKISRLIDKSIHLLHYTESENQVIDYWVKNLNLPKNKFKCFNDGIKTSPFGVCHVYISDVLLRRILDLLHNKFLNESTSTYLSKAQPYNKVA